jgi:hypothetical protein
VFAGIEGVIADKVEMRDTEILAVEGLAKDLCT